MSLAARQAAVAEKVDEMVRMSWAYDPEIVRMAQDLKAAMDAAPPVEGVLVGYESAVDALYGKTNTLFNGLMGALYFGLGLGVTMLATGGRR